MLRAALEKNTQPLGYPRTENWWPSKNRQPNNVRLGTKNVDEKKPGKNRAWGKEGEGLERQIGNVLTLSRCVRERPHSYEIFSRYLCPENANWLTCQIHHETIEHEILLLEYA